MPLAQAESTTPNCLLAFSRASLRPLSSRPSSARFPPTSKPSQARSVDGGGIILGVIVCDKTRRLPGHEPPANQHLEGFANTVGAIQGYPGLGPWL